MVKEFEQETNLFVMFVLEPLVLGTARLGYDAVLDPDSVKPHMGIDESGKGDFFGPLVIASAYVDEDLVEKLRELGYTWDWQQDGSLMATSPALPAVHALPDGSESFYNQVIAAYLGWKGVRENPDATTAPAKRPCP